MAERERRKDEVTQTIGGTTTKEGNHHQEQEQQPCMWTTSTAPYLKWKVFVRGDDYTLQGRGVCESGGENCLSAPTPNGDATQTFYQSVVAQTDAHTPDNDDVAQHKQTNRIKRSDINTHTCKVRGRPEHRPQQVKSSEKQRDSHRKTDSSRLNQGDTDTSSFTGAPNTPLNTQQASSSSCEYGRTNYNTPHPHLPSTHTLPLGPQHLHTALRLAQTNDTAALSAMLDQGLSVNTKDEYGWSLLMVAACAGALDTVQMLLTRGARIGFRDARGNTALYLATMRGHREVTEILVKANKRRARRMAEEERKNEESSDEESSSSETTDNSEYFCDVCEVMVKEKDMTGHKASIIHQFKVSGGSTRTQYGIPPSNRGYQLLVGQGWDTEGGLGSEKQGHKFPVKTVLKRDRKGLGAGEDVTARVTHFGPGDADAVKRTRDAGRRIERLTTLTRREMKRKKVKEQQEDIRLRRMLNEPDY